MIDFDIGLTKNTLDKIKKYPDRFIIMKKDIESTLFDCEKVGKKEKKEKSHEFNLLEKSQIKEILDQINTKHINDVIELNENCTNLILVLNKIKVSSKGY